MPDYCYLETDLHCPSCAALVTDYLSFQWGFSLGRLPWPDYTYHLGDAITWKRLPDGSIPPWTSFQTPQRRPAHDLPPGLSPRLADPSLWQPRLDGSIPLLDLLRAGEPSLDITNPDHLAWVRRGDRNRGSNLGDPAYTNLLTREVQQFYWTDPAQRRRCVVCRHVLEGAIVEIRDAVIVRAWIYQPDTFDNAVDYYIMEAEGTLVPRPDWTDLPRPILTVDDP